MIGIVMPLWLNDVPALWQLTRESWKSIRDQADARIYLVPNRLATVTPDELRSMCESACGLSASVLPLDTTRSVAGAWNAGVKLALADDCEYVLITANDCMWKQGSIAKLMEFGRHYDGVRQLAYWSGHDNRDRISKPTDGCDFTGAMFDAATVSCVGTFDERFRPAYFEDNDAYIRAVMCGMDCLKVPDAEFCHVGSQTIAHDAEASHHVKHWWAANRKRLYQKWGCMSPPVNREDALARCFHHPWNNPEYPVTFWERD